MEELSESERATLKQSLDDIIRESPRTELAGIRFKKVMKKVGTESPGVGGGVTVKPLSIGDVARRGGVGVEMDGRRLSRPCARKASQSA